MRAKAKRRAPRGIEKTAVMHFRVRPETLRAVKEAAAASGRTVSGECEAQLNRALVDTGTALWPILQLLSDVLAKIPEFSKAARWAGNPVLFDRASNVIGTVLEMLRPPGSIRRDATDDERQQWRSIVLSYLIQIRQAELVGAASKANPRAAPSFEKKRGSRRDRTRSDPATMV